MATVQTKSFDIPDEKRSPGNMTAEIVRLGDMAVSRLTWQPGWRWSEHLKPVTGTEWCQVRHVGVLVSGRMQVRHSDGSEIVMEPGGAYSIEPGHDGWVLGDEPAVAYEFTSADTYAKG
jgi:hypothetical protein